MTPQERRDRDEAGTFSDVPVSARAYEEQEFAAEGSMSSGVGTASVSTAEAEELIPAEEATTLETAWQEIQVRFVDSPRRSVEEAEELLDRVVQRISERLTSERGRVEELGEGGPSSTEDLRLALQRYRRLFRRLVAA